ncbi:hypothetical protein Trydic_g9576 [Trypoxylus dichotomus]
MQKALEPIEIYRQLTEVSGESCVYVKNVRKQCKEFAAGRTEILDKEGSGRPSSSDEMVEKVEQITFKNQQITQVDLCT